LNRPKLLFLGPGAGTEKLWIGSRSPIVTVVVMASRILVVEDEILVALELEATAQDCGFEVVGIAHDRPTALRLAEQADIALVDVNLRDGETGPDIGRRLANEFGVTVVFMTANPARLGRDVPGAIGVVSKPVTEEMTAQILAFAALGRERSPDTPAPRHMMLFPRKEA
jgi:two-component system, response regulator PdtaR